MLYKEIIAVCSQIHTKHLNTFCGYKTEFENVKPDGTYSDHWVLKTSELYINIQSVPRINTLHLSYKNQSVNAV